MLAPPSPRFSAQIRPPWCSTSPWAIASPSPAPPVRRCALRRRARTDRTSAAAPAATTRSRCPRQSRRPPARRPASGDDRDRPSDGVWRSALVSRFRSTRSTLLGAQRTSGRRVDTGFEPDVSRHCLGLKAAEAPLDHRMQRRLAVGRDGVGVELGELEEVVDQHRHGPHLVVDRRHVVLGRHQPSSTASSIACRAASGVRRSWLAQATSSRRTSKRRSRFAAISFIAAARSANSAVELRRAHGGRARPPRAPALLAGGGQAT